MVARDAAGGVHAEAIADRRTCTQVMRGLDAAYATMVDSRESTDVEI
jgi:hypothetical protein